MTDNQYCKLCKIELSSSVKSHIFSHFFIKTMLNPLGDNTRGIGRSYLLAGYKGSMTFLERDVPLKDFQRLFGEQDLDEDQLRHLQMDPYSKSYLFCSNCEFRLGIIENYFKDNVFSNLSVSDTETLSSAINSNNLIIRLFFLSLIWRASIARFTDFKLSSDIEERLRLAIHESIGIDLAKTLLLAETNLKYIIREALFCCTTRFFCDVTANQVGVLDYGNPYYFEINEYAICYFPDANDLLIKQSLFGLEKYINKSTINLNEEHFKIYLIGSSDWNQKRNLLFGFAASQFSNYSESKYIEIFEVKFGKKPTPISVQLFMNEMIHGDATTASRYSEKRLNLLIEKHSRAHS